MTLKVRKAEEKEHFQIAECYVIPQGEQAYVHKETRDKKREKLNRVKMKISIDNGLQKATILVVTWKKL